jgi:L-threonylcarbamoyladenylate synthase
MPPIVAATEASIAAAARRLRDGGLVAFPTETVYGLGGDASNASAVAAIYACKGRPPDHPLIVHVTGLEAARGWAALPASAERLAQAFWPGPLTMILPLADGAPAFATGGQQTIGLRAPAHPVAIELLRQFAALGGTGVAAPSANRFGKVSPTRAQHVLEDLGPDAPMILDGGACEVGVESTIVDLSRGRPVLMRPGRIGRDALERVLGEPLHERDASAPRASGTLASHYAPATPVMLVAAGTLDAQLATPALRMLRIAAWSAAAPSLPVAHWRPAPAGADEFERELYDVLRQLDRLGVDRIVIEAPPGGQRWEAVLDRLGRAATRG